MWKESSIYLILNISLFSFEEIVEIFATSCGTRGGDGLWWRKGIEIQTHFEVSIDRADRLIDR
jgi:hypothetical protein